MPRKDPEGRRVYEAAWRKANRERVRVRWRAWRERHAEARRVSNAEGARRRRRALKAWVLTACGGWCVYCNVPLGEETATLDHKVPRSKGGSNKRENLVAACFACNRSKSDCTDAEWNTYNVPF